LAAYHPQKFPVRGSFFEKNLNSNDHFDRPFLFMAMKGKLGKQRKNHNFIVNKSANRHAKAKKGTTMAKAPPHILSVVHNNPAGTK